MNTQELYEKEKSIADQLDALIKRADDGASAADPRTKEEMWQKLPTEHVASRLRFLAYRLRRSREALL